jgi:preprotein translocase subunit SecE
MNRQMKRAQERAERAQKRAGVDRQAAPAAGTRRAAQKEKRERTTIRQFLKEVRGELRKVDWPTRRELVTYTTVVLVTVTVMTSLVFGLDYVFQRAIFNVIGN